jgi:hypothetical protein
MRHKRRPAISRGNDHGPLVLDPLGDGAAHANPPIAVRLLIHQVFDLNGEPVRPERSRPAQSSRQLSRFDQSMNTDRVFGTHKLG